MYRLEENPQRSSYRFWNLARAAVRRVTAPDVLRRITDESDIRSVWQPSNQGLILVDLTDSEADQFRGWCDRYEIYCCDDYSFRYPEFWLVRLKDSK